MIWLDQNGRRANCPTNEFYGHAQILRNYCGVASRLPIRGRLQHGWCPIHNAFGDAIEARGPFYAWSARAASLAQSAGTGGAKVIGAPWIYLPPPESSAPIAMSDGLLALAIHSIRDARLPATYWLAYADWLQARAQGRDATVCVYSEDYREAVGFFPFARVVHFGNTGDRYLYRLRALLRAHKRATSPLPQTAALYAAAEGLEVEIAGPVAPTDKPDDAERALLSGQYLSAVAGWQDELGFAAKLPPEALRRLLWGAAAA